VTRALILAVVVVTSTFTLGGAPTIAHGGPCGTYSSRSVPPRYIRVFRSHERGTRVPPRVERWSFRRYVGAVMESGAWPRRPRQSGIVGAIAVKQYAWWMVLHHQPGYSWHGQCYDISAGDQYLERSVRPGDQLNRRTVDVVRASWRMRLLKGHRLFRTGWSGGSCRDGWHLCEDSITARARRGWGWHRLIDWALDPVTIRGRR
jgi:hypothetical protein